MTASLVSEADATQPRKEDWVMKSPATTSLPLLRPSSIPDVPPPSAQSTMHAAFGTGSITATFGRIICATCHRTIFVPPHGEGPDILGRHADEVGHSRVDSTFYVLGGHLALDIDSRVHRHGTQA